METTATDKANEQLIEENAAYMLGMYDLYRNDGEIVAALKLKGLDDDIIQRVLERIKMPSWEKRVRQARRSFITASIMVVVMLLIAFLLKSLPGAGNIMNGEKEGEGMLRWLFKTYTNIYYYLVLLAVLQIIVSAFSYQKYKKLLAGK